MALARGAEVDCPDIEPFEQLRPCRELGPLDGVALRAELLLEQTAALEKDQRPVFLEAEVDRLVLGVADGDGRGDPARGDDGGKEAHGSLTSRCDGCGDRKLATFIAGRHAKPRRQRKQGLTAETGPDGWGFPTPTVPRC